MNSPGGSYDRMHVKPGFCYEAGEAGRGHVSWVETISLFIRCGCLFLYIDGERGEWDIVISLTPNLYTYKCTECAMETLLEESVSYSRSSCVRAWETLYC